MRFFFVFIALVFTASAALAQTSINNLLKRELDSMFVLDQKYRKEMNLNANGKGDSLAAVYGVKPEDLNKRLWDLQEATDSLNIIRLTGIMNEYGYPGVSLVGRPTNEAAFYILQHSDVIDKYLPVVKDAAAKKEISFKLYAMMLDRSLMFQNKEQIYGTQGTGLSVKDKTTGKWENVFFIWPVQDVANVNRRRKEAGFSQTVEEYAKDLGINYKVFSLQEILKLQKEIVDDNESKGP